MLLLSLLSLASASRAGPGASVVDGIEFGPRLTLTCTWFSNFENSRFERCRDGSRDVLPSDDGASIKCLARMCEQLGAEARRVTHWAKPEPPWGTYTIRLVGRVSVHQHERQYLGDATSTVLVEKLLSVKANSVVR